MEHFRDLTEHISTGILKSTELTTVYYIDSQDCTITCFSTGGNEIESGNLLDELAYNISTATLPKLSQIVNIFQSRLNTTNFPDTEEIPKYVNNSNLFKNTPFFENDSVNIVKFNLTNFTTSIVDHLTSTLQPFLEYKETTLVDNFNELTVSSPSTTSFLSSDIPSTDFSTTVYPTGDYSTHYWESDYLESNYSLADFSSSDFPIADYSTGDYSSTDYSTDYSSTDFVRNLLTSDSSSTADLSIEDFLTDTETFKTTFLSTIMNTVKTTDLDDVTRAEKDLTTLYNEITSTLSTFKKNCTEICVDVKVPISKNFTSVTKYEQNMNYTMKARLRSLCWETMFGQELIRLTVMDLVMTIASTLAMDFFRGIFVRVMNR